MDFNDKRFGGRDNEKDRTVPPDENYYAGSFNLDKYRQGRNYDRNVSRYNNPDDYDFGRNSDYGRKELTPSEEFYKNFNTVFSDERRNAGNHSFDNSYDISSRSRDFRSTNPDSFENQNSYRNDIYSSFESRRVIEEFDRQPADRRSREIERDRSLERSEKNSRKSRNTDKNDVPEKPKKKRKKNKLRPLIAVLSAFLVIVIIIAATGLSALSKINYNEKLENRYVNSADLKASDDVTNILLLGVDARASENSSTSRSDTMILVSIDGAHNCIKMTSFLRDSWVYIPCKDTWQRLNAACSYGGYSAVADTIEYNFGVRIDGYVVADFEMFKVMIDCLGGVKIDVTEAEANEVTNHKGRYGNVLEAGNNKLTGEQALAYCRIRKIDTDWVRTERQRTVMEAVFKKAARSPIKDLKMLRKVASFVDTDLTKSEIMGLAFKVAGNVSGGFKQQACPFDGTWNYTTKSGASVIGLNIDKNKEKLAEFIYGNETKTE